MMGVAPSVPNFQKSKPPMTREQYVLAQRARMRVTRYKGR